MSSYEFTCWQAYFQLEPFGEERADYRAAIIACTIANIHGRKKGQKPFKPDDFMPKYGTSVKDRRQDPREIEAILRGYALAHNRARKIRERRIADPPMREKLAPREERRKEILGRG